MEIPQGCPERQAEELQRKARPEAQEKAVDGIAPNNHQKNGLLSFRFKIVDDHACCAESLPYAIGNYFP
ncbi:MAG TPA: hypothetical protein DCW95_08020 [Chryseobacterium sp.]|nr:hypothetical protein [Chryseobacterium sp.]